MGLHQFILDLPIITSKLSAKKVWINYIDHEPAHVKCRWLDGNKLNCQRSNLEVIAPPKKYNQSKYPGIHKGNSNQLPWCVYRTIEGKTKYLGSYATEPEAISAWEDYHKYLEIVENRKVFLRIPRKSHLVRLTDEERKELMDHSEPGESVSSCMRRLAWQTIRAIIIGEGSTSGPIAPNNGLGEDL
jgi:hypothetical protein